MGNGEYRHFNTDETIGECRRDVLCICVGPKVLDGPCRDQDGDTDGLPEREEQDSFDAKKLWHRAIKIISHYKLRVLVSLRLHTEMV